MQQQWRMGKRLVLFPLPFQGHLIPMLQLANILYSKGFSISILHTQFNSPNAANYPNFSFHPILEEDASSSSSSTRNDNPISLINALNLSCVDSFRNVLSMVLFESEQQETVCCCLITDAMWHFTQDVADTFQLPRIVLRTSNLSTFLSFTSLSFLRERGYLSATGSQLEESVAELPPLKLKDIPVLCTDDPKATDELVYNLVEKTKASKGIIFNSFEELEASSLAIVRENLSIPVFAIGPFHKQVVQSSFSKLLEEDHTCISWLDSHPSKSVLYVSFGSLITLDESVFIDIAWGLANSGHPFLWVVRPGLTRGSDGLLEMVRGRGRIIRWAPQEEVLSHPSIGGFLTHSGWNSTLESICEGVPMICLPRFGDQMGNARYVSELWRVGMQLEDGFNREDVVNAIKSLMLEKKGRELRDKNFRLKRKANLCLAEGGSSTKALDCLVAYIESFFEKKNTESREAMTCMH